MIAVLGIVAQQSMRHGSPLSDPIPSTAKLVMLGRCPAFHALVDGHDALLELDTGSFELRLSPDFVRKYPTSSDGAKLKIGDQPEELVKPIIAALGEPEQPTMADRFAIKADGIVGLDVLRKYAIGIDMVANQVQFWPGGKLGPDFAKRWTAIDLSSKLFPLTKLELTTKSPEDWFRIQAKVNGHSVNLVFDTGTAISSVNPSLVSKLELRQIAQTEVEEIGKTEVLPVMAADALTLGPISADFPVLNVESEDDPDSDGILGTQSLGWGKFIVDMPDLKFYIRQDRGPGRGNIFERRLRIAGLDIFPDSINRLLVLVKPNSPAAKAGIRSGDSIVYLGKVDVQDLHPEPYFANDSDGRDRMAKIGAALLQRNLTITVARSDGSRIKMNLPSPLDSKLHK